jgi:hypothetical protein
MPDQDRRAESPSVDHLIQIRHIMPRAVRPFVGPVAVAVSALIEREYMKIRGERRRDEVPPVRMRRAAMQEQQRPFALAAVVEAIQREAVGDEAMGFNFFNFFTFSLISSNLSPNPSPFWRGDFVAVDTHSEK